MMRAFNKLLTPIQRKVRLMVSRAVIGLVNDSLKTQRLQLTLLDGEVQDGVERFAEYGFTSVPHKGCQAVAVSIGGNRSHCIVIATDDAASRLKGLAEGEVAIYDDLEQKVHLTRNGIVIHGAGMPLTVENVSDVNVTASGAVNVTADGKATVTAAGIDLKGGGAVKGVVQGDCICAFTGAPHVQVSSTVKGSA